MRFSIISQGCLASVALFVSPHVTGAADWPQWRGPEFNGASSATGLPVTFSRSNNVIWTAAMPGPSAATPVIWGDRVYVSSTDEKNRKLLALAFDARDGKLIWKNEVAEGYAQDEASNFASPSPVTDGKSVFFFYGNGALAAFDREGKALWARNIQKEYGPFAFYWTFSSTPLLAGGQLYLQVLQRDVPTEGRGFADRPNESYLLALDPATGKERWKVIRPSDAREESREAFTTPVPFEFNGRKELLVVGGDCLTGHDLDSGKELWRWGTWNPTRIPHWRLVPSPVAGKGVILACGPKNAPIFAVKAGLNGKLDDSALAWKSSDREISSDVPTPLFYRDRFYVLNGTRRTLSSVDPLTGKVYWTGELPGRAVFETSPTGADGKIYFMNHAGEVFVVAAGDEFKILHQTAMGDESDRRLRSSIAVINGRLFLRTGSTLYCLGERKS
jgi:outer membrane protein assembly factor BamB